MSLTIFKYFDVDANRNKRYAIKKITDQTI